MPLWVWGFFLLLLLLNFFLPLILRWVGMWWASTRCSTDKTWPYL